MNFLQIPGQSTRINFWRTRESSLFKYILMISLLSLYTLYTISLTLFLSQSAKLLIACILVWLFYKVFAETWFKIAEILYIITIFLLIFNLFGIRSVNRWAQFGGFFIQFSEFAKITTILLLAKFLALNKMNIKTFCKAMLIIFLPTFLIFKQPNLGTAIIFFTTGCGLIWIKGVNRKALIAAITLSIASAPIMWHKMLPYQQARITAFLNPMSDPRGSSYQTIQSIIAIGAGGFFGSSGNQNKLGFVPENHTDFLFAYFAENFGFLATCTLLTIILIGMCNMLAAAQIITDPRKSFFCLGLLLLWIVQSMMNIGMNIGLLPVTGVALPFFSYGGSALLAFFIGLGIMLNFMRFNKGKIE